MFPEHLRGKTISQGFAHIALLIFKRKGKGCTISDFRELRVRSPQSLPERAAGGLAVSEKQVHSGDSCRERPWATKRPTSVRSASARPGSGVSLGRRDCWGESGKVLTSYSLQFQNTITCKKGPVVYSVKKE